MPITETSLLARTVDAVRDLDVAVAIDALGTVTLTSHGDDLARMQEACDAAVEACEAAGIPMKRFSVSMAYVPSSVG